jgi:hypothetical protein
VRGLGDVTRLQPQPPGTQVGTTELKAPSVPLSNPSTRGCEGLQGVGLEVLVGVGVNVGGVPVTVGVGAVIE